MKRVSKIRPKLNTKFFYKFLNELFTKKIKTEILKFYYRYWLQTDFSWLSFDYISMQYTVTSNENGFWKFH